MQGITALNKEIQVTDVGLENLIEELIEREEFLCTGDVCGLQGELI